jgi:hypothetical protein
VMDGVVLIVPYVCPSMIWLMFQSFYNDILAIARCVNGNCTLPNTCSRNQGWTGATCSSGMYSHYMSQYRYGHLCTYSENFFIIFLLAVCSSSCGNGYCSAPNSCTCNGNWAGANCDMCTEGWEAMNCNTAICKSGCDHGVYILIIPSFIMYDLNSRGQLFCNLPAKINDRSDEICRSPTRFKTLAIIFWILSDVPTRLRISNQPIRDSTKHPFQAVILMESP